MNGWENLHYEIGIERVLFLLQLLLCVGSFFGSGEDTEKTWQSYQEGTSKGRYQFMGINIIVSHLEITTTTTIYFTHPIKITGCTIGGPKKKPQELSSQDHLYKLCKQPN